MLHPNRFIAHLDMDAFYASVELLRYPQLQGHPVVIGGRKRQASETFDDARPLDQWPRLKHYTGRGVVTTATYEARALGVHSAMGIMKAAILAPEAFLLPTDFERYRHYSHLFKKAVREIAPVIEDRGIDEIYIDLTDLVPKGRTSPQDFLSEARLIAQSIKDNVYKATKLNCSIGVTPNKLLSKLCSDLEKPDGLTLLNMEDIPTRVWPLPASRINGIGPRATKRLHEMHIQTIGELAATPVEILIQHFGQRYGVWLHESALGHDERPLETERNIQSISRETTLEKDLHVYKDKSQLGQIFTKLCQRVAEDLHTKGYAGRNIGIKLKFDNFQTVTRAITVNHLVTDAREIRQIAGQCLKRIQFTRKIRLLGVRVSTLSPCNHGISDTSLQQQQSANSGTLPLF